jgi:tetratricopeptide (TPR) repeat protein
MKEGLAALQEESFEDAYYSFYDAWEYAGTEDLPEIQFYLGYSAYLIGNVAEALSHLRAPQPDAETAYYDDHLLTLAQIQIEGLAYEDAVTLLDGYIESADDRGENLQSAYLLKGLALDGHGDTAAARQSLERARDLDPASETASLAVSLMESM